MANFISFWELNLNFFRILLYALLVLAGVWVVAELLFHKIFPAVLKKIDKDRHPILWELTNGFRRPLKLYLKVVAISAALLIISRWRPSPVNTTYLSIAQVAPAVIIKVLRISSILAVAWGLVSSSKISSVVLHGTRNRLDLKISKSVSNFLAAIYDVVVIAISATALISELGYDINGLIAGLGLGGLTVALAAKDSASNFFGGLVLVMEKPFEIGDFIACDGAEGFVEDINLRSTKIRTSAGALTIVPNAKISDSAITNWSGSMEKRRAEITLQLEYSTPRQTLRDFCSSVRTMLENDPEIRSDSVLVRFSALGDSSLDITVCFFTTLPEFPEHLRIKERVNYALLELAEKHNVEFAYPTSTVYLNSIQNS